jgi:hypothetical protein
VCWVVWGLGESVARVWRFARWLGAAGNLENGERVVGLDRGGWSWLGLCFGKVARVPDFWAGSGPKIGRGALGSRQPVEGVGEVAPDLGEF